MSATTLGWNLGSSGHALYPASDGAIRIGTRTNIASWRDGELTVIRADGAIYDRFGPLDMRA